jgi:hypothetical protein
VLGARAGTQKEEKRSGQSRQRDRSGASVRMSER